MIRLSVIIVSYKNTDDINNCLASIERHNDCPDEVEVIVIDNSEDGRVHQYIKDNYQWVLSWKSEYNKGFGAGNNLGVKKAQGEYILFLNPDTMLINDVFKKAIDFFDQNKNIAYWGNRLLMIDGTVGFSIFLMDRFGIIAAIIQRIINRLGLFLDGQTFISGACFFIRKEVFLQAGQFDENIFMYNEESDLIRRIRNKCEISKGGFNHHITIIHKEGRTAVDIEGYKRILERLYTSGKYYCEKYNLSFINRIRSQARYEKLKLLLFRLLNSDKIIFQKEVVNYYRELLKIIN